jgi:predicted alpha/beta superfamily hydrolase
VGTVLVLEEVHSRELGNTRDLLVYLPPSYDRAPRRRYPVLYMHDGQNLFDHHSSFTREWQVDETLETLALEGIEAIAVGIPNTPARLDEYGPFVDPRHGGGYGEEYLRFLTGTVKPLIDRSFRTRPDREHTAILGASMGGLISLYGFFRHPSVFGRLGALSPSLFFAREAIFGVVRGAPRVEGRVYLDMGGLEGARGLMRRAADWPSQAISRCRRLARLLERKGYRHGEDLMYLEEAGAAHDEGAWARRLPTALRFLLAEELEDAPGA